MIYYRMKFQSVGGAEFNTAYFHACMVILWGRWVSARVALELRLSCTNPSK